MQKQNLCQGDFMPKNRQHYRKIKYPDKVTKQNALYLSGYFYLVLWEVEMLISRQPLCVQEILKSETENIFIYPISPQSLRLFLLT